MVGHWYVGLSGGNEMWVQAEEALVQEGSLILSRRTQDGTPRVAMALAPGEWIWLKREKSYTDPQFDSKFDAFVCNRIDGPGTRPWIGPAVFCRPQRRSGDRRGAGSTVAWSGGERRHGHDRRAS